MFRASLLSNICLGPSLSSDICLGPSLLSTICLCSSLSNICLGSSLFMSCDPTKYLSLYIQCHYVQAVEWRFKLNVVIILNMNTLLILHRHVSKINHQKNCPSFSIYGFLFTTGIEFFNFMYGYIFETYSKLQHPSQSDI